MPAGYIMLTRGGEERPIVRMLAENCPFQNNTGKNYEIREAIDVLKNFITV